jgi:hypothetical protein
VPVPQPREARRARERRGSYDAWDPELCAPRRLNKHAGCRRPISGFVQSEEHLPHAWRLDQTLYLGGGVWGVELLIPDSVFARENNATLETESTQ